MSALQNDLKLFSAVNYHFSYFIFAFENVIEIQENWIMGDNLILLKLFAS